MTENEALLDAALTWLATHIQAVQGGDCTHFCPRYVDGAPMVSCGVAPGVTCAESIRLEALSAAAMNIPAPA